MSRNKLALLALAASSVFALAGCSKEDIISRPSTNDDPLLVTEAEVINNIRKIVYDGIRDSGTTNQKILQETLYAFANSYFGAYSEAKDVLAKGAAHADFKTFSEAHKFYTVGIPSDIADAQKNAFRFNRLQIFLADIDEKIDRTLFADLSSSAYAIDSKFEEVEFARNIFNRGYKVVGNLNNRTADWNGPRVITATMNWEDVDALLKDRNAYNDYIENKLIKDNYVSYLTNQYIFDQNYPSIGRSAARKVNYIALRRDSVIPESANYLMREYIDNYAAPNSSSAADLEILASAWRGIDFLPGSEALLTGAGVFGSMVNNHQASLPGPTPNIYKGTAYGNLVERYNKIIDNDVNLTDKGIEGEFTNNNSFPHQHGFQLKEIDVRKTDYTIDGWFIRNGGLADLPSEIRNRLFNIGVANDLDREIVDSRFLKEVNGKTYLLPAITESGNYDIMWAIGETYYLIEVEEAVNAAKLSPGNTNNYINIEGNDNGLRMESIARDIANILANGTGNERSAQSFYLKSMNLQFHDQTVWDYFNNSWPELFEDE